MTQEATPFALAPADPQALIALPPAERAAVALNSSVAEQQLRELVTRSAEIKSVVDANGRKEVHAAAMALKNARVAVANHGKAAREDATAFQRAVVAEVERLAAITAVEEERLFGLRDAYDEKVAAEKAERERLAAIRTAEIAAAMQSIRELPVVLAGADSAQLAAKLGELANKEMTEAEFGDKLEAAKALLDETAGALVRLHEAATAREAAEAERLRLAEEQRLEVERLRQEAAERERVEAQQRAIREQQERERQAEAARQAREHAEQMAAIQRQQAQMQAIMDMQGLADALTTAGQAGDRAALEAAVAKSRAFDPGEFGAMAAMAKMARDAALPLLEGMLAALPVPAQEVVAEPEPEVQAAPVQVPVQDEAEAPAPESAPWPGIDWDEPPASAVPAALLEGPTDAEIVEIIANYYGMTFAEAAERVLAINVANLQELE